MTITQNWMSKSVFFFCALVAAHISLLAFAQVTVLFAAIFVCVVLGGIWFLRRNFMQKLTPRKFALLLGGVSFLFYLIYVLNLQTPPVSDFATMYNAAEEAAHGDFSTLHDNLYFYNWAYQTGFVAWQAFFIRFFGAGVTFFKVTNVLFMAITNVLIFAIARRFASETAARCVGILYALNPAHLFLASVLTNQHLTNILVLLAIYLYIANKDKPFVPRVLFAMLTGALIAFGNAIRPLGIIAVVGIVFVEMLHFFGAIINPSARASKRKLTRKQKKQQTKETAIAAVKQLIFPAAMSVVYLLMVMLLSFTVRASGLNPHGLSNNFPEWKFIVGLNAEHNGVWNPDDSAFIGPPSPERDILAREIISERLDNSPGHFLLLFNTKIQIMWAFQDSPGPAFHHWEPSPHAAHSFRFLLLGETSVVDVMQRASFGFLCGIFVLFFLASWRLFRQKKGEDVFVPLFPIAIFLLYFGVHLLIEVQPRYRDFGMMFVFIAAAYGVEWLMKRRQNPSGKKSSLI
ncbi:MAG: hypothetical protein FWE06_02660 [Oscillospiraceae bacterium]|nr:hypothetical protein [Oscillospiraceae bacterium]